MDLRLILNPEYPDALVERDPNKTPRNSQRSTMPPMNKLYLDSGQKEAIHKLYEEKEGFFREYNATPESQASAEQILLQNWISPQGAPLQENIWTTAWSNGWRPQKWAKKRILLQCSSGYNTGARQARHREGSQNPVEWSRQAHHEFTGCLAHVDITTRTNFDTFQIERIIGYFKHSENCGPAGIMRSEVSATYYAIV